MGKARSWVRIASNHVVNMGPRIDYLRSPNLFLFLTSIVLILVYVLTKQASFFFFSPSDLRKLLKGLEKATIFQELNTKPVMQHASIKVSSYCISHSHLLQHCRSSSSTEGHLQCPSLCVYELEQWNQMGG